MQLNWVHVQTFWKHLLRTSFYFARTDFKLIYVIFPWFVYSFFVLNIIFNFFFSVFFPILLSALVSILISFFSRKFLPDDYFLFNLVYSFIIYYYLNKFGENFWTKSFFVNCFWHLNSSYFCQLFHFLDFPPRFSVDIYFILFFERRGGLTSVPPKPHIFFLFLIRLHLLNFIVFRLNLFILFSLFFFLRRTLFSISPLGKVHFISFYFDFLLLLFFHFINWTLLNSF